MRVGQRVVVLIDWLPRFKGETGTIMEVWPRTHDGRIDLRVLMDGTRDTLALWDNEVRLSEHQPKHLRGD